MKKEQCGEYPEKIHYAGNGEWRVRINITEVKDDDGLRHEYDELVLFVEPSYESIINALIQDRYPNGGEACMHRKGLIDINNKEYLEYLQFVDYAKQTAKELLTPKTNQDED